jgi:hypothetical protein
MYTGTLIDDLMATVERAGENVRLQASFQQKEKAFAFKSEVTAFQPRPSEQNLLGVA